MEEKEDEGGGEGGGIIRSRGLKGSESEVTHCDQRRQKSPVEKDQGYSYDKDSYFICLKFIKGFYCVSTESKIINRNNNN